MTGAFEMVDPYPRDVTPGGDSVDSENRTWLQENVVSPIYISNVFVCLVLLVCDSSLLRLDEFTFQLCFFSLSKI